MAKDVYESLDELKSHKTKGVHYEEIIKDRDSNVTVMSIHGGLIEFGTSELAKEIAKSDFNYYNFGALTRKKRWSFHVTSVRFYQEDLEAMLKKSSTAVTIHGCDPRGSKPTVYVGGLNKKLKKLVKEKLKSAGFRASTRYFPGRYRKNVVNRAKNGGVQLELEYLLRKSLFEDIRQSKRQPNERFYLFTNAIRSAINEYLKSG